mgnify:CR=1 FL=1
MYQDIKFEELEINSRQTTVFGVDTSGEYLIKIQVRESEKKQNNISEEYEIIKSLNEKGCKTCPTAYEFGNISKSEVISKLEDENAKQVINSLEEEELSYIIQDYISHTEEYSFADVLLTLIEQKALGVYQGDVKPQNIRYDEDSRICYFIDYDQSIILSDEQKSLSNEEYFSFCSQYDKDKYGIGNWTRHFDDYFCNFSQVIIDGRLNLANTSLLRDQVTTNSVSGIYHTIDEKDVFAVGSRGIDERASLLQNTEFKKGEKVLDIGCNTGLLSMYLHDRGCSVTGVDNDPLITEASKIVSNIVGKDIDYYHMDLDDVDQIEEKFDTIMLFSVFHHTKNVIENAKKISNSCNRFIIETRLMERGSQPIKKGLWGKTTSWDFRNLDEMSAYFESIFDGFKFKKNLGMGNKSRYILEFTK